MADQDLPAGAYFHEKYQVVRLIAKGGMGAVYEVLHTETQRKRALKVMLPSVLKDEEMRNRFRAEARVASGIESEHIVETFDAGIDRATGMPFLVMELLRGEELAAAITRSGRLTIEQCVPLIGQVARTLDKTHAARVVHRDLKPENIFLTTREDGSMRVKVLDFGIAKFVVEGGGGATRTLGTPLYMAPEQFDGSSPICPQTDLYALAHITYTSLVGIAYWGEEQDSSPSLYGFLMTTQAGVVEPPSVRAARRGAQLPAGFDPWFAKATAKRSQDRFGSASEQQAALELACFGRTHTQSYPSNPGAAAAGATWQSPNTTPGVPLQAAPALTSFNASNSVAQGIAPPAKKGGSGALIAIVALLVLGAGGFAAWWFLIKGANETKTKTAQSTQPSSSTKPADASVTPAVSAEPPPDLDTITFTKVDPAVGTGWDLLQTIDSKLTVTTPNTVEIVNKKSGRVRIDILAADAKVILKVKLRYDDITETQTVTGQEPKTERPAIANKKYIAEFAGGQIIVKDENYKPVTADEEKLVKEDINEHLGKPDPLLTGVPGVPLKRGDRADSIAEVLRTDLLQDETGEIELTDVNVVLKDIKLEDGVKIGIFDVSMKVTGKTDEKTTDLAIDMKGTLSIRADKTRMTKYTLTGQVTLNNTSKNVRGGGPMTMVKEYKY